MRMNYPSVKDIVDGQQGKNIKLTHYQGKFGCHNENLGEDLGSVVGKTTRKTPETVVIEHVEPIAHKRITLCIDLYYIGGLTFLLSVSRNVCLCMVSYVASRNITALKDPVESQVSAYNLRDYHVTYILVDNESAISATTPHRIN